MNAAGIRVPFRKVWRDNRAMSLVEFALSFPILMTMVAGGTELANYATVSMRVSQLAIQVADNASRIGVGPALAAKTIAESQVNDILQGAAIQAGSMNVTGNYSEEQRNAAPVTKAKARIIISSLEVMTAPANPATPYFIRWQRCAGNVNNVTMTGNAAEASVYGTAGRPSGTNMAGMGPAGRQVTVPVGTIMMFAEVRYRYEPLFFNGFGIFPYQDMNAIAAMIVRDDRAPTLQPDTAAAICT
jgi:Flp pilus assembly protein TadG